MTSKFKQIFVFQMPHVINIDVDDTHTLCKIRDLLADVFLLRHRLHSTIVQITSFLRKAWLIYQYKNIACSLLTYHAMLNDIYMSTLRVKKRLLQINYEVFPLASVNSVH